MAKRLIDARKLQKLVKEFRNEAPCATARKYVCDVILSMLGDETKTPTVDAVEVVRCENCEWSQMDGWNCCGAGIMPAHTTFPNCFCSQGVPRNGGQAPQREDV